MNAAKTLLNFVLTGALLGALIASWVSPRFISWNNTTEFATRTDCNLPYVIDLVTSKLLTWQLVGAGIGAVVFLVLGIFFRIRMNRKAQKEGARTPPPPASSQTMP